MVKIHALCNLSDSRKQALSNNYFVITVLCLEGGPFALFLGENYTDIILIYLPSASSIGIYVIFFLSCQIVLQCSCPS